MMNLKRGFVRLFLVVYYLVLLMVFWFFSEANSDVRTTKIGFLLNDGRSEVSFLTKLIFDQACAFLAIAPPAIFWIRKGFKSDN
jgi:hypothetical protein